MNKKQSLVEELLQRMSVLNIPDSAEDDLVEDRLRATNDFWERYPEGHCNSMFYPSIEGLLSCMTEEQLQRLVDEAKFEPGKKFRDVWLAWGRAGYFKSEPQLLEEGRTPVLRVRHDCYLHWFKDSGFQNSHDAYANGSNGSSYMTFSSARRAMDCPPCSSFRDDDDYTTDFDVLWNKDWRVFRRAMFLSFAFQACLDKRVFQQVLLTQADLFDRFLNLTDEKVAHAHTDVSLGYNELRAVCAATEFDGPVLFEIPLVYKPANWDMSVYAILRFSETCVGITWHEGESVQHMAIRFPKWEQEAWLEEARCMDLSCEHPEMLPVREYYHECWLDLAITLCGLARIGTDRCWMRPWRETKFSLAPIVFWTEDQCASGYEKISTVCHNTAAKLYPSKEDLSKMR